MEEHKLAIPIAMKYFGTTTAPKCLGWGVSGSVFLSPQPDTVVKIHHRREGYETECEVYRRLDRLRITEVQGLKVPRMYECHDDLRLILMDFLNPPYLLDFAGVLFSKPDFPADKWQTWHDGINEDYGAENAWIPHAVYDFLRKHGMYYVDIRPSNINLTGHPDYVPPPQLTWDDL